MGGVSSFRARVSSVVLGARTGSQSLTIVLRSSTLAQIMGQLFFWPLHQNSGRCVSGDIVGEAGSERTPHSLGDAIGADYVVGMGDGEEGRGEHGGLE